MAKVIFLLGSESDKEHASKIETVLHDAGIETTIHVTSAHKVPEKLIALISDYNKVDEIVYVTIAGRSNGISGVTSGSTYHPVVACPVFKDSSDYAVNIHSTLQMPSNTPVLTVLDPVNCAQAVIRMLGLGNKTFAEKAAKIVKNTKISYE